VSTDGATSKRVGLSIPTRCHHLEGNVMNEQNSPDVPHKEEMAPTVPFIEWKSLHELASSVRQNKPWRTLTDTDLFALEDPVTRQVGLVSVLGHLGVAA
jgi:hypothetical protein